MYCVYVYISMEQQLKSFPKFFRGKELLIYEVLFLFLHSRNV